MSEDMSSATKISADMTEQEAMRARLGLACALCVAALAARRAEGADEAFRALAPVLLAWLVGVALLWAHVGWRPAFRASRLALGFALDGLAVTAAMIEGGGAAWLFPLYVWVILGAGALGPRACGVAAALSALAFAGVVAATPFWRGNGALAGSLLLSLAVLPLQGALLLRRAAGARAEAERANRAKTLRMASVGHELRTPLTAIVGLAGLLENSRLDAKQRDMTHTLAQAAQGLLGQIDQLVAGAREEIELNADSVGDEIFDLFALAISTRAVLAVAAEAKGLAVGLMIEAQTPRHLRGDRRRVREILQNVAGNAVKFTGAGAVAIRLGARRRDDGLWLEVEVSDTGPGIAPEARAHIFEPFRQGDASIRAKFGGEGLGLAIVRRGLDALGGEIALDSSLGEGARFRLCWPVVAIEGVEAPAIVGVEPACLPVTDGFDPLATARRHGLAVLALGADEAALAQARGIAARLAGPSKAPTHARKKILLAEDNELNGRVLEKILVGAGHEVCLARDGEAALAALLGGENFDAVLLDINMPRLGGLDVARIARPLALAPLLALTADDSAETRRACVAAGMAGCLRKPIAPEALLTALDAVRPAAKSAAPGARREKLDAAALDPAALQALDRLGGPGFLSELLVQFACDGARLVEDLRASFARGDIAAMRRQAHALESMAGNMGACALVNLCRAWRVKAEAELASTAARESGRLLRKWRMTQQALGGALGRTREACAGTKTASDVLP
jgi:two-component system sensor histidine kinase RpfC